MKNDLIRFLNEKYSFNFFSSETGYGLGFMDKNWIGNGSWKVKLGNTELQRRELKFLEYYVSTGFDDLGNYKCATYKWTGRIEVTLSFKVYENPYVVAVIKVDNLEPSSARVWN